MSSKTGLYPSHSLFKTGGKGKECNTPLCHIYFLLLMLLCNRKRKTLTVEVSFS